MLKICLSKNIQKSKFFDLTHAWKVGVSKGYQDKEILKFVPPILLKSLTQDNNQDNQSVFTVYIKMRLIIMLKICLVYWKSEPQYAFKRYKRMIKPPKSSVIGNSDKFRLSITYFRLPNKHSKKLSLDTLEVILTIWVDCFCKFQFQHQWRVFTRGVNEKLITPITRVSLYLSD